MKILITGGAGFVGSSLARLYRESQPNAEICVFDNLRRRGSEMNLKDFKARNIRFVHGDIRSREDIEATLQASGGPFDLIIEASAEPSVLAGLSGSPAYLLDTNLVGTLRALEFAHKNCGGMIFLSSSRVYSIEPLRSLALDTTSTRFEIREKQEQAGITSHGIAETFATHLPRSLYGATKLASELVIQEYAESFRYPCVINRCGVLAGPGQFGKVDQGVFTLWLANHYFGVPLSYTGFGGQGLQVRDLLHPEDLFSLLRLQTEKLATHRGAVYNVGGGRDGSVSMLELTNLCQEITAKKVVIESKPETNAVDIPLYISDTRKVRKDFPEWKVRISARELLSRTFSWLKENESDLRELFGDPRQRS